MRDQRRGRPPDFTEPVIRPATSGCTRWLHPGIACYAGLPDARHGSIGGQAGDFLPIPPAACYVNDDIIDSPKRDRNDREIQKI